MWDVKKVQTCSVYIYVWLTGKLGNSDVKCKLEQDPKVREGRTYFPHLFSCILGKWPFFVSN